MIKKYAIYFIGTAGTLFSAYGCDMTKKDYFPTLEWAERNVEELTYFYPNIEFVILTVYKKETEQ